MTQDQLRDRLAREAEDESMTALAQRYQFSQSFLSRVISGEKDISERLANAMGYTRMVIFEPRGRVR